MTSLLQTIRRAAPTISVGITRANLAEITRLGPDLIVTGSAVFAGRAPAENARAMLEAVAAARPGAG